MKTLVVTGLLASFVAGGAMADMLYYQGFEDESWLGSKYYDYGDSAVDHWLSNNPGEMAVNGDGFSAWYGSTGGPGFTDGDYTGVTDYTGGGLGSWYEGSQGYQISDTDGIFELHFDGYEGSADTVSMAVFIADTGWEPTDHFSIHWGSDPVSGTLYDISEDGLEGNAGAWMLLEFDVSALGEGHLHIRVENNSSVEVISLDSVSIMGSVIPTPGALALLGLAGFASRRRRR